MMHFSFLRGDIVIMRYEMCKWEVLRNAKKIDPLPNDVSEQEMTDLINKRVEERIMNTSNIFLTYYLRKYWHDYDSIEGAREMESVIRLSVSNKHSNSCHKAHTFIPRTRSLDQSIAEAKGKYTRESSDQYIHSIGRDVNVDARKNDKGKQEYTCLENQVSDEHGIRNSLLSGRNLIRFLTEGLPRTKKEKTYLTFSKPHVQIPEKPVYCRKWSEGLCTQE